MNEPIKLLEKKLDDLLHSLKKARELEPDQKRLAEVEKNINSQIETFHAAIESLKFLYGCDIPISVDLETDLATDYSLIPMSDITDEARELAVSWMECEDKHWIENKHKLASDIINYAWRYSNNEIKPKEDQICYKTNEVCVHNCNGLCKESC